MLDGHKNVVYAVAFNNPFADKIVTGSFDRFDNVLKIEHVLSPINDEIIACFSLGA